MQFVFEQIRTGGDRNFAYLLGDRKAREAAIVDPSFNPKAVVERARAQGLTVTRILNTHGHPDHVNGNKQAVKLTGAPVVTYRGSRTPHDVSLDHEESFKVGAFSVRALYTPGHAADHLSFLVDDVLISGDVLFVGKVGGTGSDADARTQYASVLSVLFQLVHLS